MTLRWPKIQPLVMPQMRWCWFWTVMSMYSHCLTRSCRCCKNRWRPVRTGLAVFIESTSLTMKGNCRKITNGSTGSFPKKNIVTGDVFMNSLLEKQTQMIQAMRFFRLIRVRFAFVMTATLGRRSRSAKKHFAISPYWSRSFKKKKILISYISSVKAIICLAISQRRHRILIRRCILT